MHKIIGLMTHQADQEVYFSLHGKDCGGCRNNRLRTLGDMKNGTFCKFILCVGWVAGWRLLTRADSELLSFRGFIDETDQFPIPKCAIFRKFKEVGGIARRQTVLYAAQAIP